jgi:arylsulfatase A
VNTSGYASILDLNHVLKRLSICLFFIVAVSAAAAKPNIILIMADDLGAEGLACYNSSIYSTPNLDSMAQEGMLFRNAYSTPLCTPTRVMIMTGQYGNRTGFRALIGKSTSDRIPASLKTSGHYLKDAGYRTAIAGKWQLGQFDHIPTLIQESGYDEHCMWKWYFGGKKTKRYYTPGIWHNGKSADGDKDVYGPDRYTDFVVDFIERNKQGPFFVYFPMALVHSPFPEPPSLRELAISNMPAEVKGDTRNYGHMITYMDMLIGRIIQKVKDVGQDDNTIIMFTADNGSPKSVTSQLDKLQLQGGKGSMTEAGTRVPFIVRWPGQVPAGKVAEELFSLADVLPTLNSIVGIKTADEVDGMDLSHNFLGKPGTDRDHIYICYRTGTLVRDKRFRLHDSGDFYDIPQTSDASRYAEKKSTNPEHDSHRKRLQMLLDSYPVPPVADTPRATVGNYTGEGEVPPKKSKKDKRKKKKDK